MHKKKGNRLNVNHIIQHMQTYKLTKTAFARQCGISLATLNKVLAKKENLRIIALFKICKVLNIHIKNLFY